MLNNNRNLIIAIVALVILGLIVFYFPAQKKSSNNTSSKSGESSSTQTKEATSPATSAGFTQSKYTETKVKNISSSVPANNTLLKSAPKEITLKASANLVAGSEIMVVSDKGVDVVPSGTKISADLKTLSVPVSITVAGNYKVDYKACFADQACSNGSFGFSVDLSE